MSEQIDGSHPSTQTQQPFAPSAMQQISGAEEIADTEVSQQTVAAEKMQTDSDQAKEKRKRSRGGKRIQAKKLRQAVFDAQRALAGSTSNTPEGEVTPTTRLAGATSTGQSNAVNRHLHHLKPTGTPKRGLVKGDTPPDVAHVHKRGKIIADHKRVTAAKPTMAEAVVDANLVLAIVDMPVPDVIVPLTQEKYSKLHQTITAFIMQSLETPGSGVIPTFGENTHTKGAMKIRCSTPASKTWLQSAIQYFPPLWKDMKLKAINFSELPRPKKVLGLFQHCNLSNANILKMIGAMNAGIDTEHWSIISRTATAKGTHIVMGMNEDQLAVLMSCNFQLHFGAGIAKFKDISKKTANADASSEAGSDMEVSEQEENDVTVINNPPHTVTQNEGANTEMRSTISDTPENPTNSTALIGAEMDLDAIEADNSSGNN